MILSLQGCMAVGKTTAVRYLQENAPYIHISYEDNRDVIEEIRRRKLDKNKYPDYLEIQKLWLHHEVVRYQKAVQYPCSIMDFGAEEIEFYGSQIIDFIVQCLESFAMFCDILLVGGQAFGVDFLVQNDLKQTNIIGSDGICAFV